MKVTPGALHSPTLPVHPVPREIQEAVDCQKKKRENTCNLKVESYVYSPGIVRTSSPRDRVSGDPERTISGSLGA